MDVEKIRAAQPCFQSTPSVAEIEAHAKAWPLVDGAGTLRGGLWNVNFKSKSFRTFAYLPNRHELRVENGVAEISAVTGHNLYMPLSDCIWLDHVQWMPVQPNGVPVGMAVAEDLVQCRQCNYNGTLDECPSRMPDYAVECPSCMSNELTVYRVSEDAAAVEVTPDEN